jgi:hypothetical protein
MELLYAVYSPLWLRSPGGKHNNLFHLLVSHFTSRTTNKLLEKKYLKTILTCGSNSLFNKAQCKHPSSFYSGRFASCDFFMALVLDPQKHSSTVLKSLFAMQETHSFMCPLKKNNHTVQHPQE